MAHYKGTKHAKKLKALDAPKSKLKGSVVTKDTANQEITKGINTAQVPNGTERKGLCFPPPRCIFHTCSVVFFMWLLLLCEDPTNAPFWHFTQHAITEELDDSLC